MKSQAKIAMTFSFDDMSVYEIGATVLVVLTTSEAKDTDDDRGSRLMSLCKWALTHRAANDSDWAEKPSLIKPKYAAWSEQQVDHDIRLVNRRMRDRMIAARIALPFLKQAQTDTLPVLNPPLRRLTVNKLAERALGWSEENDASNLKTRVWRPSRPVIHLAAAVEVVQQLLLKHAKIQLDYNYLLWNEVVIRWILAEAEKYEPLLTKAHKKGNLKLDPTTLIRLRVAPERSGVNRT